MRSRGTHANRPSSLQMARSRGAITGPLLILLGAWGALIPFFGHSFGYGFTPSNTWHWTEARGWLEVAPGAAAFLGGALLTMSSNRISASVGGWLAAAGGGWFVIGRTIAPWWSAGNIGLPTGSAHHAVWEQLGMFDGLGVVIILAAALALGRVSVVGLRDVAAAQSRQDARDAASENDTAEDSGIDLTRPAPAATPEATTREGVPTR